MELLSQMVLVLPVFVTPPNTLETQGNLQIDNIKMRLSKEFEQLNLCLFDMDEGDFFLSQIKKRLIAQRVPIFLGNPKRPKKSLQTDEGQLFKLLTNQDCTTIKLRTDILLH